MFNVGITIVLCLFVTVVGANPGAGYVSLDQVEELLSRVTAPLLDRIDTLELKVAGLEKEGEERQGQIRQEQEQVEQLQIKIETLETELKLQVEGKSLETEIKLQTDQKSQENVTNGERNIGQKKTLTGPSNEVHVSEKSRDGKDETLKENGTHIIAQHSEVASDHGKKRQAVEHPVAFDVKMATIETPLNLNQDIVFDTVLTNVGGAYHANHGLFVAPVNGIYVFSASVLSLPAVTLHCSINVNGQDEVKMYGFDTNAHNQASQSLVIQLNAGDDVSVRAIWEVSTKLYGDSFSSFSGFLLHEIFTE